MSGNDYGNSPVSDTVNSISVDEVVKSLRTQFEESLIQEPVYIGDMQVNLVTTSTGHGGQRYWFICPACKTRVAKLYVQVSLIACRHCHGLKYRSSRYKGMVEEQIFKKEQL